MEYGLTLTLTAVLVVFFALTVLFFCYTAIGKLLSFDFAAYKKTRATKNGTKKGSGKGSEKEMSPEVAAAIAMALEKELCHEDQIAAAVALALEAEGWGEVHDKESFVITISR